MAIGVLSALAAAGRRVPADVAVVACDDMPFAEYLTPPLSSVRVPFAETGQQAVQLLLKRIRDEPVPAGPLLLPVELVVRDSCGGRTGAAPGSEPESESESVSELEPPARTRKEKQ
jgi:LacI family transcriptional regulator